MVETGNNLDTNDSGSLDKSESANPPSTVATSKLGTSQLKTQKQ
jgi:hypothetical protein